MNAPVESVRAARVPRATYRLQLHAGFGFAQAAALLPYIESLGISHLYVSPLLRARPGSLHGYDVVEHGALNPELGTRADFDRLVEQLHARGMGLLVDIVPNHMGVLGNDNAWWLDVLENGQASDYADHFDIDWAVPDPALRGKVLLPILGDQYGIVLERGELRLRFDATRGRLDIDYFEHRLPLDPASFGPLLIRAMRRMPAEDAQRQAVQTLATALSRLPPHDSASATTRARRRDQLPALQARLAELVAASASLRHCLESLRDELNGRIGQRSSFDALDALIDAQPYRLAHWRVAGDEINYRRFFDVNGLAALRQEREQVFEATHGLILRLAAEGAIDGLRVDHPDGLADPAAYFRRLQCRYAQLCGCAYPGPTDAGGRAVWPLYVVAEKILAPHEQMPRDWALHGTTGYRFANVVNGVLVDDSARARLDRAWRVAVRDEAQGFEALSWLCRRIVMAGPLAGELGVLSNSLLRLAREDRRTRDFTFSVLRRALIELVAAFPVYRTYIVDEPSAQDRRFVDWAIGVARRRTLGADASLFDFLKRVLLGRPLPGAEPGARERCLAFTRRLQQYTAPVAAKGIEDTALYRHHRLVSLNDVGGDPEMFGLSVPAFHAASRDRALNWPSTMLCTTTHDAKRSEDVRCRIDVISEMPAAWRLAVRRWTRLNRRHKRSVDGRDAPSRNDEYLLYQLLVGSLPCGTLDVAALADYAQRIEQVMLKSAREAKVLTSWINPHAGYEAALSSFVQALLLRRDSNLFLPDLQANVATLAWFGALNGLSMTLLKCLSPGVPDIYQGHEAIELSLVDPDNRRSVDFQRRAALLDEAQAIATLADAPARAAALGQWLAGAVDGRAKLWVTWRALQLRRDTEEMLRRAEYLPLAVRGSAAQHVVAFARRDGVQWLVVVAVRLPATLLRGARALPVGECWGDTAIVWPEGEASSQPRPDMAWLEDRVTMRRHALRNGVLPLGELLREWPVAALYGVPPAADAVDRPPAANAER
jgi:(1->4)-alpha-D-glucan 1-alpha-D-glucosylmutase